MDALRELKKIVDDPDINDRDRKQAIVEILRLKPDANYVIDILLPKIRELQNSAIKIKIWAIATEEKIAKQYRKDWRESAADIKGPLGDTKTQDTQAS